jgi:hypothetical protein
MIYDDTHYPNCQQYLENLQTSLPCPDALDRLKEVILLLDKNAAVTLSADRTTARWTSRELAEPILISALEENTCTSLWFEGCAADAHICRIAKQSYELESVDVSTNKPDSALQVVERLMANSAWTKHVLVLPQALKSAADCPYIQLDRLSDALERLAAYAVHRTSSRGISAEQVAGEVGLGTVYRPHISFTATSKYHDEYVARWNNRTEFLREHLTLGGGCNDRICMSIHFLWDNASKRVVIGHIGRHCTTTLSRT